jgi:hypothetical protein
VRAALTRWPAYERQSFAFRGVATGNFKPCSEMGLKSGGIDCVEQGAVPATP